MLAHVAEIDQRLPDGIERGSADVAEYDAERGECQASTGTEAKLVPPCGGVEHQGENLCPREACLGLNVAKPRGRIRMAKNWITDWFGRRELLVQSRHHADPSAY